MLYVPLGGAVEEIGASCHYLKVDGTGIILDAGADPEKEGQASVPDFDRIHDRADWPVDHIVLSHAHHDHIGSLPVAVREFPHVTVHMSAATRSLIDVLLPASARLQRRRVMEGSTSEDPLYSEDDLEMASYLYLSHKYEEDFDLTGLKGGFPVTSRLYDAGHVLGSAGILITAEENGETKRIFYTGDTGVQNQTIIPGATYPDEPVDVLLLESTLGADAEAEHYPRRGEEKRLGEAIAATLGRGGTVLIPAFSLGRSQEILALVDQYKRRKLIPEDIPVYTAGMMRAISDVYDKTRFVSPRLNEEFQVFGVPQRRLPRGQSGLNDIVREPGIFIVGSGMMFERTISNKIAQKLVSSEKNGIYLVGFAREDSPADKLLQAYAKGIGTEVVLNPTKGPQPVKCHVDRFRFSGHANRRDLIDVVEHLDPETIVLLHGEQKARQWMADNIAYFFPDIDVRMPERGESVEI